MTKYCPNQKQNNQCSFSSSVEIAEFRFGVNLTLCVLNPKYNAAMMKRVLSSSAHDRHVINLNLQRTEQHCTCHMQ